MKRNFQGQTFALLVTAGLIFGNVACTKSERESTEHDMEQAGKEMSDKGEMAYNDFRNWVNEKVGDTVYMYDRTRDYNKEISENEAAYNERLAAVEKYQDSYDDAHKNEIEELKTRYNQNWDTRKTTYTTYTKSSSWRPVYLTVPENSTDLNTLTPANIRAAYENFVAKVEANKSTYTNADWQVVDAMWSELDARKNMIQSQLSSKDKYEIGKAKTKYETMKSASKTANTAENVGSKIKSGVETGAEKTAEGAKDVGSKIGNAAKKVGSETKDLYKKAEDKVDGTDDRK